MFQNVPHVGSALRDGPQDEVPATSSHLVAVAVVYLGMQMYVARSADPLKSPLGSQPMHPCAFRDLFESAGTCHTEIPTCQYHFCKKIINDMNVVVINDDIN